MKTTKYTAEDLTNDPSLKWNPYRKWELVWSDSHSEYKRFVRHEKSLVRLAEVHSLSELHSLVPRNSVRRLSL